MIVTGCAEPPADPPREANVLHRGNGLEPETLDPHRVRSVEAFNVVRDLYEGLTAERADGTVGPGVAREWQVSDDGLTWTFTLRDDARWSNGDPVTAEDFAWSLARAVDPDTGSYYAAVELPGIAAILSQAQGIIPGRLILDQRTVTRQVNGEVKTMHFVVPVLDIAEFTPGQLASGKVQELITARRPAAL
jgi:oligopeptide transport system substrate-binding protein